LASVHATCSNAATLDTSASHFAAVSRIATDDAAYGASDVEVAGDFSVHYDTYFKVVNTYGGTPKTYVLRLCGGAEPTAFSNGTALPTDATHFTIPVTGVGLAASVPVTFMEMLGLRDKIKLVNPEFMHSPCVQHLEESEQIDTQTSTYGSTDWADRASAHPEVEVVFTDSSGTGKSNSAKDVVFDASSDPGALARAEWIKFMSLFFNLEEQANLYFSREQAAFAGISTATAAVAAATTSKTCAWVQHSWTGNYEISYSKYKQELCVGAGLVPWTDTADLALGTNTTYKKVFTTAAACSTPCS